jgi:hypothetical protein
MNVALRAQWCLGDVPNSQEAGFVGCVRTRRPEELPDQRIRSSTKPGQVRASHGLVREGGNQSASAPRPPSTKRSNDRGGPISGVFSGPAAPIAITIAFPKCGLIGGDCEPDPALVGAECEPEMPLVCGFECRCLQAASATRSRIGQVSACKADQVSTECLFPYGRGVASNRGVSSRP